MLCRGPLPTNFNPPGSFYFIFFKTSPNNDGKMSQTPHTSSKPLQTMTAKCHRHPIPPQTSPNNDGKMSQTPHPIPPQTPPNNDGKMSQTLHTSHFQSCDGIPWTWKLRFPLMGAQGYQRFPLFKPGVGI